MKVLEQPDELSWVVFPGRDANSIFNKTPVLMFPNKPCVWRRQQTYVPCSMPQIERPQSSSCKQPSRSTQSQHQDCLPGGRITFRQGFRSLTSLWSTEDPSGQPTAWNGSTRRFVEGQ